MLWFATLALAVLGTAGCGSADYARRQEADRALSTLVGERLASDPTVLSAKLDARAHSGVVALVGEAPDENVRVEAERIVRVMPGVARVDNLILVVKGDSRAEGSTPAKGALLMARTE